MRWTCKSRAKLTAVLSKAGWRVSSTTVSRLLHELGYSLQSVRKSLEGTTHPDRDEQFEHINTKADDFLQRCQPVVSVDTKKKELVGEFKNGGREWQPKGNPEKSPRVAEIMQCGSPCWATGASRPKLSAASHGP